ncbi:hypothetical protein SPRG_05770 [Saprolegnia parasitica CBS 223.65]|uniref:EF-hand domain-containing protein n=1 Tax=Saprolegnia parasitica (strain CBS 223.65) TaxID=695850 RepID=A0A067CDR1_SAPPC|nr:hypothetical protein SPRG_05770 [Saprolegnia parasitica CBS 223.65]KDO28899.1 hypothetical protein SPRG_05770 [Saprolegnia parasitica CBS 223.65]|eukprot:XP_012200443.1 hypothetical protein SPRG_05770 [Saprolegnia parasitica CBS 223.65]
MAELQEAMIDRCIDDIWHTFDQDQNGYLDREETRAFIDAMAEALAGSAGERLDFDACFDDRDEMRVFVMQLMGL